MRGRPRCQLRMCIIGHPRRLRRATSPNICHREWVQKAIEGDLREARARCLARGLLLAARRANLNLNRRLTVRRTRDSEWPRTCPQCPLSAGSVSQAEAWARAPVCKYHDHDSRAQSSSNASARRPRLVPRGRAFVCRRTSAVNAPPSLAETGSAVVVWVRSPGQGRPPAPARPRVASC